MTPRRIYCKKCGMVCYNSAEFPHVADCDGGKYPTHVSFIAWLHGFHVGRRGPVGDLSREVRLDSNLPLDLVTLEDHLTFFWEAGWHPDTDGTVRQAWAEGDMPRISAAGEASFLLWLVMEVAKTCVPPASVPVPVVSRVVPGPVSQSVSSRRER